MSGRKRVVFICSGNICRSPMAEAMLSASIEKQGLDLEASSAGTLGIEDHAADPDAIKAVGEEGIDLRNHRSRGVS
ncbi:MAG: low molecular weight phosphatase family protein, partial [Planctomycetota bacterium]|nr:low molecular weight phosphatase family protein [Planctomycetota bacterium]